MSGETGSGDESLAAPPLSWAEGAQMQQQSVENDPFLRKTAGKINHVLRKAHNFDRSFLGRQSPKAAVCICFHGIALGWVGRGRLHRKYTVSANPMG